MKVVNGKILIITVILAAIIAAGCTGPSDEATVPESIKIGLVAPLSGVASVVSSFINVLASPFFRLPLTTSCCISATVVVLLKTSA